MVDINQPAANGISLFANCSKHGRSPGFMESNRNVIRCKLCRLDYNKKYKRQRANRHLPGNKKCSILGGCMPRELYYKLKCEICDGRWTIIQGKYLTAFKPQLNNFEWNRI